MEWIKTILPLLGVLIGWLLSESGKIFADKRQDKRKLKKLLYFLLELRYHFSKELSYELDIDRYINLLKNRLADKAGIDRNAPELNVGIDVWKPFLENLLAKSKTQDKTFEYLSENIEKILIDLAEILPILAYELSGRHNIKERLNKVDNYFSEVQSLMEDMPFDIKQWVNPKLTKELLDELDDSIEEIARQIDNQTLQLSKDKIATMTFSDDTSEMEVFIDEYLEKAFENIQE